ncbi:MAG: hypothetical protein ACMXYC_03455 [Candidatus Woesearchaeota archaeon]
MTMKAQIAFDYVMTYGWILVLIVGVSGALFFYGVFDIEKTFPEECVFENNIRCLEVLATPNNISVHLQNNMNAPVVLVKGDIDGCTQHFGDDLLWNLSDTVDLSFNCPHPVGRQSIGITLTYYHNGTFGCADNPQSCYRNVTGRIRTNVK